MGVYKGIQGGVTSMVASRFVPWHHKYNEDRINLADFEIQSAAQASTMAGLDWHVNKLSLAEFMPGYEGAKDFSVMLRSDKPAVLGIGSDTYTPIQIEGSIAVVDAILASCEGSYVEAAGALYDPGKVTWFLIRLPDQTTWFGTDSSEHHERYILVTNAHDSSLPFTIRPTDVRVQCMNTMSMAWRGSRAEYVIRHTTNAQSYVEEAARGMAAATANWQAMDAEIQQLLNAELTTPDFMVNVIPAVIGERPADTGRALTMWDARFDEIVSAYRADHNEALVDTAWGAVNAVNEYEEWAIKPRGQDTSERQMGMLLRGDYPLTRKALALVSPS